MHDELCCNAGSLDSRLLSIEKDGLVYIVCACVNCPKILGDRDILVNESTAGAGADASVEMPKLHNIKLLSST